MATVLANVPHPVVKNPMVRVATNRLMATEAIAVIADMRLVQISRPTLTAVIAEIAGLPVAATSRLTVAAATKQSVASLHAVIVVIAQRVATILSLAIVANHVLPTSNVQRVRRQIVQLMLASLPVNHPHLAAAHRHAREHPLAPALQHARAHLPDQARHLVQPKAAQRAVVASALAAVVNL